MNDSITKKLNGLEVECMVEQQELSLHIPLAGVGIDPGSIPPTPLQCTSYGMLVKFPQDT